MKVVVPGASGNAGTAPRRALEDEPGVGSLTPTLEPGGDGRLRSREILSGVGARGPGSPHTG
jgi:hypothetical protein